MALVAGPGVGGSHSATGPGPAELTLVVDKHVKYIQELDSRRDELDYWLTEHLRLNGVYWGLTALHLLGHPDAIPRDKTLEFVFACQNSDGGFGAAPGHDSHMLYTVSAVQVLATINALSDLETAQRGGKEAVARYIAGLQDRNSGTFAGDEWGETDTRFLYGAFNALSILDMMHLVDIEKAVSYIQACANFDGGFGRSPGAESHAGQIFTCLGALSIVKRLDLVDSERLGAWLSERQLSNGGLNGRPEKLVDVCYSWWVLSSLAMLGKLHWIDAAELTKFILKCQDVEQGGISDRPGDMVDVFHTVFGVAGLSLLGYPGFVEVDPVYCMPRKVTQALPYHLA
ncbi:Rab geranylgeranyltransferase [Exophiala dermatitidis]|uniref:Geranylgeranyl transferase type-2 subunit beta n=2 Tax=Exophiala dermatitidis TaxID=5970 RepID=H6BNC3_EXODN|nr:protein geranylgeranyltransferase type II [Exophiala dermatitidis NIH/UT8656]KAJ4553731.1 Rab geranylgeranyltransferase, variant 2 [Exophiala dermatitidis]EHY52193.1 protein geranylgeranyltransferase type II [Exophiala dermatitidis NIH/UT8656]KAJ4578059.1 Rab geranylgeranyltransferase, variant 2 [Exophiala dermatitidis]KAJ4585479.1 Rab geranylgeranyltransferase, variant 2 [Exophiala dermatitidis]KAJ4614838.1 Rab geranylgeranyltransferase [Exophiala dermatitidis]